MEQRPAHGRQQWPSWPQWRPTSRLGSCPRTHASSVPMLQKAPIGNGAHESGKTGPRVERIAPVEAGGVERIAPPETANWGESPHPLPGKRGRRGKRGRERMKAVQQPHVDGKRLGRPRGRGARSTPEPKLAPVPDFSPDFSTPRCPLHRHRENGDGSGRRRFSSRMWTENAWVGPAVTGIDQPWSRKSLPSRISPSRISPRPGFP